LPKDAHLNHSGNGWECDRSFSRRNDACVRNN
jgi:hypothetical protein